MNEDLRVLRVLVVEDELLIRWSITETLAHAGHTVIEAADGASAIMALKTPNGLTRSSSITDCPTQMI